MSESCTKIKKENLIAKGGFEDSETKTRVTLSIIKLVQTT